MIKVVRVRVAASGDDGQADSTGTWDSALALTYVGNIGFGIQAHGWARFLGIRVPRGAKIVHAYLDYIEYDALSGAGIKSTIKAEAADNPTQVVSYADFVSRTRTTAYARWNDISDLAINAPARSPDIRQVIQEVVNRIGWADGNAISLFHEDAGSVAWAFRSFWAYEGSTTKAPLLHIEYEDGLGGAAIVTVHDDFPSFAMLAEFRTAHDINRLLVHTPADKGPGTFSFAISRDDPQANRDTLRKGLVVAIRSTKAGCPPFLGRIDDVDHRDDGTVEVTGPAYAQVLFERALPQDCSFSGQAAGVIAMQLLRLANSQNPTGVWPSKASEPGSPIRGDFDAGIAELGAALNDLADKTGDEWWLEEIISRQKIEIALRWGRRRGQDRSREIALYEGKHFTASSYKETSQGVARSAIAIGGGEAVSDRAAVAVTMGRPASVSGKATVIGGASEVQMRNVAAGMTLARDVVVNLPLDTDEGVLAAAAQKSLEVPANAAEEVYLTLAPSAPWDLGLGDCFTAVLPNVRFGGVSRKVRLLSLQPDEAMGERDVAVSVQYD